VRHTARVWLTLAALSVATFEVMAQTDWSPVSPKGVEVLDQISKYSGLEKAFPGVGKASPFVKGAAELYESYKDLSQDDKQYDPNYRAPGTPQLSANCAGSAKCASCYAPAYEKLNQLRYRFEKLRRVYGAGKNFAKRSLAFGDSVAGSVGVGGLEWVKQRMRIEQSVKGLENAYDAKYDELMGELDTVLREIAACESSVYGQNDWYERYGFMYRQFMATVYARAD